MNGDYGCFGKSLILATLLVIALIMNGWAISVLWGWFVVDIFGLQSINIPEAIGLTIIMSLFRTSGKSESREFEDIVGHAIGDAVINPLIAVFMGWCIYIFL